MLHEHEQRFFPRGELVEQGRVVGVAFAYDADSLREVALADWLRAGDPRVVDELFDDEVGGVERPVVSSAQAVDVVGREANERACG